MNEHLNIIEELKALDLATCTQHEILNAIRKFRRFGLINMTLHKGKPIIRVRGNKNGEHFKTRSQLSYVPAEFNKTYQRASTPEQTMFYGSVLPASLAGEEVTNARLTALLEGSALLRDPNHADGEEILTFSKWVVTDDIPLIAIVYHKDFLDASPHMRELYDAYQAGAHDWSEEDRTKNAAITEYLASHYANKNIQTHTDYKVSATFSQLVTAKGLAGVYFPSVRADAKGFNVAIHPDYVDRCLKLVAVGECTAYKRGKETIVDNDMVCTLEDDSLPFTLEPIASEHHMGKENVLKELEGRGQSAKS